MSKSGDQAWENATGAEKTSKSGDEQYEKDSGAEKYERKSRVGGFISRYGQTVDRGIGFIREKMAENKASAKRSDEKAKPKKKSKSKSKKSGSNRQTIVIKHVYGNGNAKKRKSQKRKQSSGGMFDMPDMDFDLKPPF
jgi:hypothetical protein